MAVVRATFLMVPCLVNALRCDVSKRRDRSSASGASKYDRALGEVQAALVGPRAAALEGHLQRVELFFQPTDTNADIHPATGQEIEIGNLFRGVDRIALRDKADR